MSRPLPIALVQTPSLTHPAAADALDRFEDDVASVLRRYPQTRLVVHPELHLTDVPAARHAEVAEPLDVPTFDDWWRTVPTLAGPLATVIASLPPDVAEAIRAHAAAAIEEHTGPTGVHLPGVSLVGSARVP